MMTYEKWMKIEALMESPASTENEKKICRKLLKDNPKPPKPKPKVTFHQPQPRSQQSGDFWRQAAQGRRPYSQAQEQAEARSQEDAARRQQQAAQGSRFYPGAGPDPLNGFFRELERLRRERGK